MIYDIFQSGLIKGSERLPFDPEKSYAYVEHPTEGWRVYLRSCIFLHEDGVPFNCHRFIAVKRTGAPWKAATWEPPKGQMEGKDISSGKSIRALLEQNVRRETEEEAYITHIIGLKHTGLAFQGQERDFPRNWYFQYHIFQGRVDKRALEKASAWFQHMKANPKEFAALRRDQKEKDAIDWYSGRRVTPLNPRWCPQIADIYFNTNCDSGPS